MNYLETILSMQLYNYYGKYNEAKKIYEKYSCLVPKNNIYLQNKLLNEYEIACKKFVLKSKPRSLYVELFDKCQLACIMCNQHRYNYVMPKKHIFEILDLLPYLDTITWQGGEVFLYDKFADIVEQISKYKKIVQKIVTNFQCIRESDIKKISKLNNVKLILSIDSPNKFNYEKIRKGSSFNKLIKNIELVNKYRQKYSSNLTLHINFVILKENFREMLDIIDFAKKYKFTSVSFNECLNSINYDYKFDTNIKNLIDDMLKMVLLKAKRNNINVVIQYPFKYIMNMKVKRIKNKNIVCKNPWYKFFIGTQYSFASDCSCFKREQYGNLTIEKMWNSKLMQDYRKNILNIKQNNNICNSKCFYYASQYFEEMGINN